MYYVVDFIIPASPPVPDKNQFQLPRNNISAVSLEFQNAIGTQKIILEQEKEELQAVVSAWKACLSGKRKVIDGDSLISTVEKLNGVREAEQITRERGAKRQKVFNKHASKARRESSD